MKNNSIEYIMQELFSEVVDLKRHVVHYGMSGRSRKIIFCGNINVLDVVQGNLPLTLLWLIVLILCHGTREVVFARRVDVETTVKRYNNVQLDGKPLKLEIVGTNSVVLAPNPQPRNWQLEMKLVLHWGKHI